VRSWCHVGVGLVVALAMATTVATPTVASAEPVLRIEPATVGVAHGASFTVKVVQDAPLPISGAQASIDFDPAIVQVESVALGTPYASAPIVLPEDIEAAVLAANTTGRLAQIAAAHTPPDAVPAGAATFLVVRFRAVGCGETDLTLPARGPFDAQMISGASDVYGDEVPVSTAGAQVTTCVGPDAITADPSDLDIDGAAMTGLPVALVGAGGVIAAGLLGGLALRARRRERHDDVAG